MGSNPTSVVTHCGGAADAPEALSKAFSDHPFVGLFIAESNAGSGDQAVSILRESSLVASLKNGI